MFFFFFLFAATLNRACFLFSSQSQALAHYKGTKHAKKLKALDAPKTKLKASVVTKETANQEIAKGINTSPVPNGTDRKGLCVPACCTFSDTCFFVVFSLCSCSSVGKRALDPANAPFLSCFFSLSICCTHTCNHSRSWMDSPLITSTLCWAARAKRAGCPLCARISNLWSLGDLCRTQADIRGMKRGLSMLQTKCSWDQQGCA